MAEERPNADLNLSHILAHCELFTSLSVEDCELIAASCEPRIYTAGSLLLSQGDHGEEMYILIDGALEIFKRTGTEEVILQRLYDRGTHLGERAMLESSDGMRRVSVRCLSDSQVLAVPKAVFRQALRLSPAIMEHVDDLHHRQIRQVSLVETSFMYRALAVFDQQHGWSREEHFEAGQVIVKEGDPSSAVYVVRSGSVKRCRMEDGEEIILSVLHEGQTFGGLAMMQGRPHSAAAVAESAVELVTFDRERFVQATATVPELHKYLDAVERVYAMSGGLVTLLDGEFRGQPAIVTVVPVDDGREVIVNHVINQAIYSASHEISPDEQCEEFSFRDEQREILRILTVHDGRLVGVYVKGPWEEMSRIHALLLVHAPLTSDSLELFVDNGHLLDQPTAQLASGANAILCQCLGLTRSTIESVVAGGALSVEDVSRETGATTVCGACSSSIASFFTHAGQTVTLCEEIEVTPDVRSFRFMPYAEVASNGEIAAEPLQPALPGQHVVLSAEIDGAWVHRPYTITSPAQCTEWREITVKREDFGLLSNWLFKHPQEPHLKLSHPTGDVWVDPKLKETVVCLVAGIGITPALGIARSIVDAQSDQIVHIDYSVLTEIDVAYRQEFDELAASHDNISVIYRATGGIQFLDLAAIAALHHRLPDARYIVCGPQGYMQVVQEMLLEAGVNADRVQLDVFAPVGHLLQDTHPKRSPARQVQLIATLVLCGFYLIQSAFDWGLPAIVALQEIDLYRFATGSLLILFIGVQWYLPYLRFAGKLAQPAVQWHSYQGVLAPVLLYLHSVSLGFAYTFVLALLFVLNTMVGALDKTLIGNFERRQRFQRIWLLAHVPAACLISVLALIHMVYALAYK